MSIQEDAAQCQAIVNQIDGAAADLSIFAEDFGPEFAKLTDQLSSVLEKMTYILDRVRKHRH